MITLPLRSERVPLVRVLIATNFTNKLNIGGIGPWVEQRMLTEQFAGLELMDNMSRAALPEIGECEFRMRYGVIDGKMTGMGAAAFAAVQAGGGWDPTQADPIDLPSLIGKEIRVQMAPDIGADTPAWVTVWWGSCEYESDKEWPAATMPVGERTYHCYDGLFRTKRWYMTRHAAYLESVDYNDCPGHPGYNVGLNGKTLGNMYNRAWTPYPDSDGKLLRHAWQGSTGSEVWTDLRACEHALRVSRLEGQPQFTFAGNTNLLHLGASPWPIDESESAFDVLSRICARERGRGLVFVDWVDDTADPTGPLNVRLYIASQVLNDVQYTTPDGAATVTVDGATSQGTTVAVDLIGDHRAQPQGFNRSARGFSAYDAVETVGERIQILVTMSMLDLVCMEKRWSAADATAFAALDADKRLDEKWRPVYQSYGLPRSWGGKAGDHNNGATIAPRRVDWSCDGGGSLTDISNTSPLVVHVLPDLPLLEGYTYAGTAPVRTDGGDETGEPARRPPLILNRLSANGYVKATELTCHIKRDAIHLEFGNDEKSGYRLFSDTSNSSLGAFFNTNQLGITVALELPHRVRLYSIVGLYTANLGVRNVKRVQVDEAHLWLASEGAIWDLDFTIASGDGYAGKRLACKNSVSGGLPGILRDDRARVALIHHLACAWYLQEHQPANWTLRACGLLPNFMVSSTNDQEVGIEGTTPKTYPLLGQLVTTLAANGQTATINAPITGILYKHQEQTTTWSTDWWVLDSKSA